MVQVPGGVWGWSLAVLACGIWRLWLRNWRLPQLWLVFSRCARFVVGRQKAPGAHMNA